MKKIALTQRLISNDSYFETRETLDIRWGHLFKELGFLPIVLPYGIDFKSYFKYIDIDGVILTGGNDLSSLNNSNLSVLRDEFERNLIEYAISRQLPIFGVCRGMQIIGEFFNCSLKPIENHVGIYHSLVTNKESKYSSQLEKIDKVNAYHNYSLDNITDDILISATDKENVVKAIEHKHYKIFGQMWHIERENPFRKTEMNLIKKFFESN